MNITNKGYAYYALKNSPELFLLERVPDWSVFGDATFASKVLRDKQFSRKRTERIKRFFTGLATVTGDSRLKWFWRLELSPSQNYHIHFVISSQQLPPHQVCSVCRSVAKACGMFATVEEFKNEKMDDDGLRLGLRYLTKRRIGYEDVEQGFSPEFLKYLKKEKQ